VHDPHDEFLDRLEAGLVLQGTKVKALRTGSAQVKGKTKRDMQRALHEANRQRTPKPNWSGTAARPRRRP
jgi:hypothetical protein